MAQEVGVEQVYAAVEAAFGESDLNKVEGLIMPAVDQFPDNGRFWFYVGCLNFKRGYCAQASLAFERSIELDEAAHVYSNLGACYRRMYRNAEGLQILMQGLDRQPDYAPTLVNIGSMYVNEGTPEKGIPYLEKAVEIGTERGAIWNLGLLYLESARFAEGFDCYREGVNNERGLRHYGSEYAQTPEPKLLDTESWNEVVASGRRPKIIIWGEQGIGDEIMFSTIFPDVSEHFEVIFECHPRLQRLHQSAHPNLKLYPTRKDEWIEWPVTDKVQAEFKAPIGDLGCYYRRDLQSFIDARRKHGALYRANPEETARYRAKLETLAEGRPIIGLATRGGVMTTSRPYRTLRIGNEIDRLMANTDALFVALDYDDMSPLSDYCSEKFPDRYLWYPSIVQHWDYDHAAALVAATDMVVTVNQSIFHLAGAMGHPTRCLTPTKCAWRYAPIKHQPELSFWYPDPNVRLYRQDEVEGWAHPIDRVVADINALSAPKVVSHVASPGLGMAFGRPRT